MIKKMIATAGAIVAMHTTQAQLKVLGNGNVGIGTVNPTVPLHIKSLNSTSFIMEKQSTGAWDNVGLDFILRSNMPPVCIYSMEYGGMTNGFGFGLNIVNNGSEKNVLRIDPVGNGYFYGNWYANQSWLWSDKKLKNNINTSTKALEKILALRGVSYEAVDSIDVYQTNKSKDSTTQKVRKMTKIAYGKSMPHKSQYGFVAQELELVLPNLVSTTENGTKSVNYIQVIPLLVEALKEQNTKIEKLESRLLKLEKSKSNLREDLGTGSVDKPKATSIAYLYQNTPNPFSQETSIKYSLPETVQSAFISITDLNGKQLISLPISNKGENSVTLQANKLYAGIFVYTLVADGNIVDSKRMVIVE